MFKKFLSILLLTCGCVHADFYVGGTVGVESLTSHFSPEADETGSIGSINFKGGGFVGYNFDLFCDFDLGAEAFITADTPNAKYTSDPASGLRARYDWGFRLLPGWYLCDDCEIHLILGYTCGNFKIYDDDSDFSRTYNSNGYQLGLGTRWRLPWSCNWSLRLDVIYSGYGNKSFSLDSDTSDRISHLKSLDGILSLIYAF